MLAAVIDKLKRAFTIKAADKKQVTLILNINPLIPSELNPILNPEHPIKRPLSNQQALDSNR
jgi:hypothetical protein